MKKKKAVFAGLISAAALLLFQVSAFADAVAPGSLEMLTYRIADYLPAILITIGVLGIATAVILIVVFRARKKKRMEQDKKD